jgi:hypothetical protein
MLTAGAARSRSNQLDRFAGVATRSELLQAGLSYPQIEAQLSAARWQEIGRAVVLHNGAPTREQAERVALIECGPRAVLTSFTAAARWGLRDWHREEIHVLAPGGTCAPRLPGIVLHRTRDWPRADVVRTRHLHRLAPALLIAAASFRSPRPGCGILAAAVQQRLTTAADIEQALRQSPRVRHRASLVAAAQDIAQGAHALSEIDLRRLCRRFGLPLPTHQAVRIEPDGRRRYLDAEWRLSDGRAVAVEIDGAYHLSQHQAGEDQVRQNAVVIKGTLVLRYQSITVRDQPERVAAQLAEALGLPLRPR